MAVHLAPATSVLAHAAKSVLAQNRQYRPNPNPKSLIRPLICPDRGLLNAGAVAAGAPAGKPDAVSQAAPTGQRQPDALRRACHGVR